MAERAFLLNMQANGVQLVAGDALIQPLAIAGGSACRVGAECKIGRMRRKGGVGCDSQAETRAGPLVISAAWVMVARTGLSSI
ncbi:hypothetical protein A989_03175 [Xanthomonas translucens DAR61454]|nr:hypothetical protein A989_03175 [Xanthomonas translucens DAR61454]